MTRADWQERLAPWIGSEVQVVTKEGKTIQGRLTSADVLVYIEDVDTFISLNAIRTVWVQLALAKGGQEE